MFDLISLWLLLPESDVNLICLFNYSSRFTRLLIVADFGTNYSFFAKMKVYQPVLLHSKLLSYLN